MTVIAIIVNDLTNPIEVQTWLNTNVLSVINYVILEGSIFYIFYT